LRARTRFRRYRGRRVPFSCFVLPDLFSVVSSASGPIFNFGGTKGVGSRFHVLRARTFFRRYRGVGSHFLVLRSWTRFRRYRGRRVPFYTPGLVFDGNGGVRSRFLVLCARTRFWRYRGSHVPFASFALPDTFPAVPRASCPVFMFYAPRLVFGGVECVVSRFHVLCSQTLFRR
jgi:hypothetical protein